MARRTIVSGILGGIVLIAWTFVVNVGFGLSPRIAMNPVPDEARVYEILKQSITRPGGYVVNPPLTAEGVFPAGAPVFAVRYSGFGHEAAGRSELWHFSLGVIASLIAASLLLFVPGLAYGRKVLFFATLGLLFAVVAELPKWDIAAYPLTSALLLAGNAVVSWTLAGLAIAWVMRAPPAGETAG